MSMSTGKQKAPRARTFTSEEKTLLLQLANAEKSYLKGRFGPTITKKGKALKQMTLTVFRGTE